MSKKTSDDQRQTVSKSRAVAFIHPDLGLGGAERLVVDTALELRARHHTVVLYTLHLDPQRCFSHVLDGSCGKVVCVENRVIRFIRRFVWGHALRAALSCAVLAASVPLDYDVVFVDLVAIPLMILWWKRFLQRISLHWKTSRYLEAGAARRSRPRPLLVYYCHFPDRLLAPGASFESVPTGVGPPKQSETWWRRWLRSLYRSVVDSLEACSIAHADRILVNSQFTSRVVERTFPRATRSRKPCVLYPPVPASPADVSEPRIPDVVPKRPFLLCISRFERKKRMELAVHALALLYQDTRVRERRVMLVIAGGYDERLTENVEYHADLQKLAEKLCITEAVIFAPNVSDAARDALLSRCVALVYTPSFEHFGIVPLEAMRAGKPVVACNSGGPRETVVHEVTGLLCDEPVTPEAFSQALKSLVMDEEKRQRLGQNARERAVQCFSRKVFGDQLVSLLG